MIFSFKKNTVILCDRVKFFHHIQNVLHLYSHEFTLIFNEETNTNRYAILLLPTAGFEGFNIRFKSQLSVGNCLRFLC